MSDSVLDAAVFGEMRELMGDALGDFIKTYINNTPQLISKISSGLSENNVEAIYHAAHQIKGGSGSIGALQLADAAYQIEIITKSGSTDGVSPLVEKLKTEYAMVATELAKLS